MIGVADAELLRSKDDSGALCCKNNYQLHGSQLEFPGKGEKRTVEDCAPSWTIVYITRYGYERLGRLNEKINNGWYSCLGSLRNGYALTRSGSLPLLLSEAHPMVEDLLTRYLLDTFTNRSLV